MASSSNVKAAQVEAPPKMLPPREHTKEVLHQRHKLPYCPLKMAIGGFVIVVTLGYFTLYSQKKPEASAVHVARVTTGVASPENTNPPK